jgi:Tfp pilus assembly protein PilF
MRILHLAPILALACAALPAEAQRGGEAPRRPALAAAADSNDSRAYYDLGVELIHRRPREAADAFYWAAELEPRSAEALYARHAAMLMSDPRRILDYHGFTRRPHDTPEMVRIDSLYYRALMLDPFVQRRFEREVLRVLISSIISGGEPQRVQDQTLLHHYTANALNRLPPLMRARVRASQGRLAESMEDYDAALGEVRRSGTRTESRRWIHHERARVFALAGNDRSALNELAAAIEATEERERDVLVRVYTSKALLEHSRGMLHERSGDLEAAREAYARALVEDLSYHPAHARLAGVALALGDTAAALDEMALAVAAGPGDPVARLVHGSLLASREEYAAAEAELTAATTLAPLFAEPWLLLGAVRERQGNTPGALEAFRGFVERVRRDDPRRAQVEAVLAQVPG